MRCWCPCRASVQTNNNGFVNVCSPLCVLRLRNQVIDVAVPAHDDDIVTDARCGRVDTPGFIPQAGQCDTTYNIGIKTTEAHMNKININLQLSMTVVRFKTTTSGRSLWPRELRDQCACSTVQCVKDTLNAYIVQICHKNILHVDRSGFGIKCIIHEHTSGLDPTTALHKCSSCTSHVLCTQQYANYIGTNIISTMWSGVTRASPMSPSACQYHSY